MKRFTETGKWADPWFRSLKPIEKLVFMFVIENCNNAGFYEVDYGLMAFTIGLDELTLRGAIEGLGRGLIGAESWVWVRQFLKHQKNEVLNIENNAHKQIIGLIKDQLVRFGKNECFRQFLAPHKGLVSPIGKVKVKDKREIVQKEGFEIFWTAYPKKDAKQKAAEAWQRVDAPLETVIAAIERQKASNDWRKDRGKWIPLPASWLNGRRWEDQGAECDIPLITTTAAPREDRLEDPMERQVREALAAADAPAA